MRCLKGCLIKDTDEDAMQLDDKSWLCGSCVDNLLGRAPQSSTDSIGRAITPRRQPTMRSAFSASLGAFAVRKRVD